MNLCHNSGIKPFSSCLVWGLWDAFSSWLHFVFLKSTFRFRIVFIILPGEQQCCLKMALSHRDSVRVSWEDCDRVRGGRGSPESSQRALKPGWQARWLLGVTRGTISFLAKPTHSPQEERCTRPVLWVCRGRCQAQQGCGNGSVTRMPLVMAGGILWSGRHSPDSVSFWYPDSFWDRWLWEPQCGLGAISWRLWEVCYTVPGDSEGVMFAVSDWPMWK